MPCEHLFFARLSQWHSPTRARQLEVSSGFLAGDALLGWDSPQHMSSFPAQLTWDSWGWAGGAGSLSCSPGRHEWEDDLAFSPGKRWSILWSWWPSRESSSLLKTRLKFKQFNTTLKSWLHSCTRTINYGEGRWIDTHKVSAASERVSGNVWRTGRRTTETDANAEKKICC